MPSKTKPATKKKPNNRVRRKFTDAKKSKIVQFAEEHSVQAAAKRFNVHGTLIGRWRSAGFGKPERKPNKRTSQRKSTIVVVEQQLRESQAENRELRGENRTLRDLVVDSLLSKKVG